MTVTHDQTGLSKDRLKKDTIMDTEIWRDIPGYEGKYQASNLGRIKNLERIVSLSNGRLRKIKERILKLNTCGCYPQVDLGRGYSNRFPVHRLVASTFIPNPDSNRCINHINGVRSDNRPENLEWCTYSENSLHAVDVIHVNGRKNQTLFELNGIKRTAPYWCRVYSKPYKIVAQRLDKYGWSIEDALFKPIIKGRPKRIIFTGSTKNI